MALELRFVRSSEDRNAIASYDASQLQPFRRSVMVCLVFPDDTDWYVANWVFRVFAESVKHQYPADLELAEILDAGLGAGGLFLSKLRSDLLERTMASLDEVVRKTLSGELTDWLAELEDEPGRKSGYLTGVDRLRQAIEDYEIGGKSGGRE